MKKTDFEILGKDITEVIMSNIKATPEQIIGGLSASVKILSTISDLEEKDINTDDVLFNKPLDKVIEDIDELSLNILKACNELFNEVSLSSIVASLAGAALKVTSAKETIRNTDGESNFATIDDLINAAKEEEEGHHKCHADCPVVESCPRGKELFPAGKEEATAEEEATTTKESKISDKHMEQFKNAIDSKDMHSIARLLADAIFSK